MATPVHRTDRFPRHNQATPERLADLSWGSPSVSINEGRRQDPAAAHRRSPPRLIRDRFARPGLVRPSFGLNDSVQGGGNESEADASFIGRRNVGPVRALVFRTSAGAPESAHSARIHGNPSNPEMPNPDGDLPSHGRLSMRTEAGAIIAEETNASILRDEQQANNSGLLAHAPTFSSVQEQKTATAAAFNAPTGSKSGHAPRSTPSASAAVVAGARLPALAENPSADKVEGDRSSRMAMKMRRWMHDALQAHLYDTAIFWGDKVLSLELTEEAYNDAYFLANAYFLSHHYQKAFDLLATPLPDRAGSSLSPLDDNAQGTTVGEESDALEAALAGTRLSSLVLHRRQEASKQARRRNKRKDRSFTVSGTGTGSEDEGDASASYASMESANERSWMLQKGTAKNLSLKTTEAARDDEEEVWLEDVDRCVQEVKAQERPTAEGPCLISYSQPCRYLGAQCLVRLGRFYEALDLLGRDHTRWQGSDTAHHKSPAWDGGIKLVSSACHLRGLIYLRLDELDKARESFMKALSLDVKNYEAFAALLDGSLLAVDALWDFVQNLDFHAQGSTHQPGEGEGELDVVRYLYTVRLPKQSLEHSRRSGEARKRLAREFNIGLTNPEVLLGLAEELYTHLRFEDAHTVTSRVMEISPDHQGALPLHIGCMYHLERLKPSLFIVAHRLVENDPDNACSWYAVGAWYAATDRWLQARRYFSKASMLDPRFAPAWIAFAHSFAMQGESDQAIVAYSTAARKFQQSHLPKVFIGMEHVHQGNFHLADLFFKASSALLPEDPLCLNESGVVAFHRQEYDVAISTFSKAIAIAKSVNESLHAWTGCMLNLAHAHRCAKDLSGASRAYREVLDIDPHNATAYLGLAIVKLQEDRIAETIELVHEALAINPRDPAATALLEAALSEFAESAPLSESAPSPTLDTGEWSVGGVGQSKFQGHISGATAATGEQSASMSLETE
ncbi:TPR-like protein [Tilletiaria anomala UBC 951]|uniref:TPR-like protein n=1 Tax=Tilletiaria anomala (strain ATCC 24038 / CBS 436.72 / UBC 951) TaxID=1037660 RepID=A0A066WNK9_TILAU|nr:TPR-like protein [Tilletiaria anomala UBC 951]KDN52205.1 TPR-like protein [Tilletiaria anomala UBC 951]